MIRPALVNENLLRQLNSAVIGAAAVVALAGAGLTISLVLEGGAVKTAQKDRLAAIGRETAAKATIARAKTIPLRQIPVRPDQQLEMFGSTLAAACLAEGVQFTNFDNAGEMGPYTTRYSLPTEGKEWNASEARVTIHGRLADIYTVLAKLKGQPIPFEVAAGSIDGGVDDKAVRASMTIVVVVREEKNAGRG